jgi:hypothetical protein
MKPVGCWARSPSMTSSIISCLRGGEEQEGEHDTIVFPAVR